MIEYIIIAVAFIFMVVVWGINIKRMNENSKR